MKEPADVVRTYFGMVRRWARLIKPKGKDDGQAVLDALSADEFPDEGVTQVRGPQGEVLFEVWTAPATSSQPPQVRASALALVYGPATEDPPPPSDG